VSTGGTPRSKSGSHQLHLLELKVSIMPKQSHVFVSLVRLMSLLTAVLHRKAHGTLTPWIEVQGKWMGGLRIIID
jgi:hypothetical protein